MIPAVSSHSVSQHKEEACCCLTLCQRVQEIWNAICTCICELARWLCASEKPMPIVINRGDIALSSPDAFHNILTFLHPEDVGRSERVNRAWHTVIADKEERVWKTLCKQEYVDYQPKAGEHKRAFSHPCVPTLAFGPSRWKHNFGDPGIAPMLPACIHRKLVILKDSCTLTLIPATLDGEPLTIKSFASCLQRKEMAMQLTFADKFTPKAIALSEPNSLWVFMRKTILPNSEEMSQKDAQEECQLGKALWITVSAVAHFVQNRMPLLSSHSLIYTRTSDEEIDASGNQHFVQVGGTNSPGLIAGGYGASLAILLSGEDPDSSLYVLPAAPVHTFSAI